MRANIPFHIHLLRHVRRMLIWLSSAGLAVAAPQPIVLPPQPSATPAPPSAAPAQPSPPANPSPTAHSAPAPNSALPPLPALPAVCLESGDGYLHARLGGAIDTKIDWPNSGTRCQGEPKDTPAGVRLSFQRVSPSSPDLLFVFGITGVREGKSARDVGMNLTVIVQGTSRIYGTLGDSRCTVDSLAQRPLKTLGSFRVEARGFCTQPAHAVRGRDAVLMSTFDFAGLVTFSAPQGAALPAPVSTVK